MESNHPHFNSNILEQTRRQSISKSTFDHVVSPTSSLKIRQISDPFSSRDEGIADMKFLNQSIKVKLKRKSGNKQYLKNAKLCGSHCGAETSPVSPINFASPGSRIHNILSDSSQEYVSPFASLVSMSSIKNNTRLRQVSTAECVSILDNEEISSTPLTPSMSKQIPNLLSLFRNLPVIQQTPIELEAMPKEVDSVEVSTQTQITEGIFRKNFRNLKNYEDWIEKEIDPFLMELRKALTTARPEDVTAYVAAYCEAIAHNRAAPVTIPHTVLNQALI